MRRTLVVGILSFAGAMACSHDWDIVPPGGADGGSSGASGTSGSASSSSTSGSGTTTSSGNGSTSGPPPPPPPLQCPADCDCGGGTCNFECTANCTINCPKGSTCVINPNGHTCTAKAGNVSADCSTGTPTCKVTPSGKDMQCKP